MSPILLLSIILTTLVLLGIGIILYFHWRKKQRIHLQLVEILDDITDQQSKRKTRLLRRFTDKLNLQQSDAQPIAEQLIAAEKLFLQQMMEQLLQQTPNERLYEQLCELLDTYFNQLIGLKNSQVDANKPANEEKTVETAPTEASQPDNPDTPPEPDWGDVFD
ncbi:MAG: hypothetical protein CTY19_03165 [Methylomonas sp.]|jgi:AcrR family transcriptional regulator|nr:MAG: hypothetical protein CTY19_03165 [Methylomonas sp.]